MEDVGLGDLRDLSGSLDWQWVWKGSAGRAGGIITGWDAKKFVCRSWWFLNGALVVNGQWIENSANLCLINVYAPCHLGEQISLWDSLYLSTVSLQDTGICIGGDFNAVRNSAERAGRSNRHGRREMEEFNKFIDISELFDIPLQGRKYTWYKDDGTCKSRLDRFLINSSWLNLWPDMQLSGAKRSISDHCPIVMDSVTLDWGAKPFKSINAWLKHGGFVEYVDGKWRSYSVSGWGGFILKEKLKLLKGDLKLWSTSVFGRIDEGIEAKKTEIQQLDIIDEVFGLEDHEVILRNKTKALLIRDLRDKASILKQKSKVKWIKNGDSNSSCFHKFINCRSKKNYMAGLEVSGCWSQDVRLVKQTVFEFFKSHYSDPHTLRPRLSWNFSAKKISPEENSLLIMEFSEAEVLNILKYSDGTKSPGPDGMNMKMFKICWATFRSDILTYLDQFHTHGKLVKGLNHSFISLVPKKDDAACLNDFRPISLVGAPYKILSKLLASRLSKVIGSVISECQSAFIKGRQITDAIAALNVVIEGAKDLEEGCFCYKIDFAKAFDSINWGFLRDMLTAFGFDAKWINWVTECYSTAHASVLVNGSPTGDFALERGLRQGDPLSPFLFILAAEVINIFMERAVELGLFEPVLIGGKRVKISHLQYADDTIFLGTPSIQNALLIKRLLILLEFVTGLRINPLKCQLIGLEANDGIIADMAHILGCKLGGLPFNYLGVSMGASHRKVRDWDYVVAKIERRLQKWERLKLSYAGRLTLIKSVLNALPTYVMSIHRAPLQVIKKITRLQRNFLWTGKGGGRKVAWISWQKICTPKRFGGLGVKDLELYNKSLGKWVWKWLDGSGGIWGQIIESRWGIHPGFGDFDKFYLESCKSSGWWREVIKAISDESGVWFCQKLRRIVGDGRSTSFWNARWANDTCLRDLYPRLYALCNCKEAVIGSMGVWNGDTWSWEGSWRRPLRSWEEDQWNSLFSNLMHPSKSEIDRWKWGDNIYGEYSTNEAYQILLQRRLEVDLEVCVFSKLLWNKLSIPKVQFLSWRVINGKISTLLELSKRHCLPPHTSVDCPLCLSSPESISHLFFECKVSCGIWFDVLNWIGCSGPWQSAPGSNLLSFRHLLGTNLWRLIAVPLWQCIIWMIWSTRNDIVFNSGSWDQKKILGDIKGHVWCWYTHRKKSKVKSLDFNTWCCNFDSLLN